MLSAHGTVAPPSTPSSTETFPLYRAHRPCIPRRARDGTSAYSNYTPSNSDVNTKLYFNCCTSKVFKDNYMKIQPLFIQEILFDPRTIDSYRDKNERPMGCCRGPLSHVLVSLTLLGSSHQESVRHELFHRGHSVPLRNVTMTQYLVVLSETSCLTHYAHFQTGVKSKIILSL